MNEKEFADAVTRINKAFRDFLSSGDYPSEIDKHEFKGNLEHIIFDMPSRWDII